MHLFEQVYCFKDILVRAYQFSFISSVLNLFWMVSVFINITHHYNWYQEHQFGLQSLTMTN